MGARILLVEDHPTMREAVRLVLEHEGFIIEEAADGQTALDMARRDPPDVVMLDLHIPGVDGEAVLRELKSAPATTDVKVVIVTAEGEEGRARALALGADDYLAKPFSPHALIQTVERATGGSGRTGASP